MDQRLMGNRLLTARTDAESDMSPEESVLILMNHCRDMKRQETLSRIATLLLLCGCAALFLFINLEGLKPREERASGTRLASMKQERLCPPENNESKDAPLRIHLNGDFSFSPAEDQYLVWNLPGSNEGYKTETRTVVIPREGFYFINFKFRLGCVITTEGFQSFWVELHRLPEGYDHSEKLTEARDGLDCDTFRTRTVYVGRLVELNEGDRLGVKIRNGSTLIQMSEFSVFRI